MTQMLMTRDASGSPTYGIPVTENKYGVILTSNNEATLTVPSNHAKWEVLFSIEPGASVWISINGTASIPALNAVAALDSMLNPGIRSCSAGDVISLITSNTTAQVGIEIYEQSI